MGELVEDRKAVCLLSPESLVECILDDGNELFLTNPDSLASHLFSAGE